MRSSVDVTGCHARVEDNRLLWRPAREGLWEIYAEVKERRTLLALADKQRWPLFLLSAQGKEPLHSFTELGTSFYNAGFHRQRPSAEQVREIAGTIIQNFAKKWGGLGLCQHLRPWNHGALWGWGTEADATLRKDKVTLTEPDTPWVVLPNKNKDRGRVNLCGPYYKQFADGEWVVEPLRAWVDYALAILAVRRILESRTRKTLPEEWAILHLENFSYGVGAAGDHFKALAGEEAKVLTSPTSPKKVLELLNDRLYEWLLGAPLIQLPKIDPRTWQFQRDYMIDYRFGVFPVIVTQLLHLDPMRDEVVECANCKDWFQKSPKATRGKNFYCERCQRASHRHAQSRYLKRQKEKKGRARVRRNRF